MIFVAGFVIALVFTAVVIFGSLLWSEYRRLRPPISVKESVRQQTRREIAQELRDLGWVDAAEEISTPPDLHRRRLDRSPGRSSPPTSSSPGASSWS